MTLLRLFSALPNLPACDLMPSGHVLVNRPSVIWYLAFQSPVHKVKGQVVATNGHYLIRRRNALNAFHHHYSSSSSTSDPSGGVIYKVNTDESRYIVQYLYTVHGHSDCYLSLVFFITKPWAVRRDLSFKGAIARFLQHRLYSPHQVMAFYGHSFCCVTSLYLLIGRQSTAALGRELKSILNF